MNASLTLNAAGRLLEPLCTATAAAFTPPNLFPNDYLLVEVDEELKRFIVQPTAMRRYTGVLRNFETEKDIIEHNGEQFVKEASASGGATSSFIRRVPERTELGHSKWKLAGTDFTALLIYHCWPEDRIVFLSDNAKLLYNFLLSRFQAQHNMAVIAARYKQHGTVPDMPADYVEHHEYPLLPFQKVSLMCMLQKECASLFMEPGCGKTPTTIARICLEALRKRAGKIPGVPQTLYRALIVCPNAVRMNWQNEFEKFATIPGKVGILRGDLDVRRRKLIDAIRNEDGLAWGAAIIGVDAVENTLEELTHTPWDLLVVDESHLIKNHRTSRWQALMKLRQAHVRQRLILTGTPIANTLMDLWAQFEFLGDGMSGFMSFANFRKFHGVFVKSQQGSAIEKLVGFKNIPLIQERLARISFMITKKEANLQLPEKVYDTVEVQMTAKQAEWYNEVKEQLALELADLVNDSSKRITADHVLTKLLRLAQITCGHVKWDDQIDDMGNVLFKGRTEPIPGGNPKVTAVMDMIRDELEQDPRGKKIIWACFRQDIFTLQAELIDAGIGNVVYFGDTSDKDREIAEYRFNNDPNIKVFLANPATAGAGLNLLGYPPSAPDSVDTYADHEIFFSQNWQPVLRSQAEDRAHRKGTRCNVRITDLVVPGTVDEDIRARVLEKQKTAMTIQDVREILRHVLDLA